MNLLILDKKWKKQKRIVHLKSIMRIFRFQIDFEKFQFQTDLNKEQLLILN